MKLMVCQTCHKASALCGQPLRIFAFCPSCAGRQGGSSRSEKKQQASRRNIGPTRLMRDKRRKERRQRGQVIRVSV